MNERQLATVLAALRLYQEQEPGHCKVLDAIATNAGLFEPLSFDEIDALAVSLGGASLIEDEPKLTSYNFDLGNSSDGPIGCCARVSAYSPAAAVEKLKSFLEQHADIEVRGTRNEATEGVEYLTVYLNPDAVTADAIDDSELV